MVTRGFSSIKQRREEYAMLLRWIPWFGLVVMLAVGTEAARSQSKGELAKEYFAADQLRMDRNLSSAAKILERILPSVIQVFGDDSIDTAHTLNLLGLCYGDLGEY